MNLSLRDGLYDENLNKTNSIFNSLNIDKKVYIVSKGRRYEVFVSATGIGTISIIDVTDAGKYRGDVVRLALEGFHGDSTKLKNLINAESGDDPNWYIEFFKIESKDLTSKSVSIGGQTVKRYLTKYNSGSYFSLLGTYKRLKKRPKKWNVALLMRALLNYQVQEIRRYKYDDMSDTNRSGKKSLTKNTDLAEWLFIAKPSFIHWSREIKYPNIIHVVQHSNEYYDLEILDEVLRI